MGGGEWTLNSPLFSMQYFNWESPAPFLNTENHVFLHTKKTFYDRTTITVTNSLIRHRFINFTFRCESLKQADISLQSVLSWRKLSCHFSTRNVYKQHNQSEEERRLTRGKEEETEVSPKRIIHDLTCFFCTSIFTLHIVIVGHFPLS